MNLYVPILSFSTYQPIGVVLSSLTATVHISPTALDYFNANSRPHYVDVYIKIFQYIQKILLGAYWIVVAFSL
jgi:hypothetical protein